MFTTSPTRLVTHTSCALLMFAMASFTAHSADSFIWDQTFAKRKPGGGFEWAPKPFTYTPGNSQRYIDYDKGNDNNDGKSKASAWKHHPWDVNATGHSASTSGIHTYVFKGGVHYRGSLIAKHSGKPNNPIRLTRDPAWGKGHAIFAGSVRLDNGWKKVTSPPEGLPSPDKVYVADVKGMKPITSLFIDGKAPTRIPIARHPNWTISNKDDVLAEWAEWKDSKPAKEKRTHLPAIQMGVDRTWMSDPELLTAKNADAYKGGRLWTEYAGLMGSPYPMPTDKYDPATNAIQIGAPWSGNRRPIKGCRYFLENHPRFLDQPGEYWHDVKGGKLYVRLPGDKHPNGTPIELASNHQQIMIQNQSHINISGFDFRYQHIPQIMKRFWDIAEEDSASIKIFGSVSDVTIKNNIFQHVFRPIWISGLVASSVIDNITISDNTMQYLDNNAIQGGAFAERKGTKMSRILNLNILRNFIQEVGQRPRRAAHGHTIDIVFADVLNVAGNIIKRTHGSGIFLRGGKNGGKYDAREFVRILVFQNDVDYSCMTSNDWGGIETWQGGPAYIFDNMSTNPGGYWHYFNDVTDATWKSWNAHMDKRYPHKSYPFVSQLRSVVGAWTRAGRNAKTASFAYPYYFDGAFKQYLFNNIGSGRSSDLSSPRLTSGGIHAVGGSFMLNIFNNTLYRTGSGIHRGGTYSSPDLFMGNTFVDMGDMFMVHEQPKANPGAFTPFVPDADPERGRGGVNSLTLLQGWAMNMFEGKPKRFGTVASNGEMNKDLKSFQAAMKKRAALATDAGTHSKQPLLRDPAKGDFRPTPDTDKQQHQAKLFIPWSVAGTVGEWQFRLMEKEPDRIAGEHWIMDKNHVNRGMYKHLPRHDLTVHGVSADSYTASPYENWTKSALSFDGKQQHAVLSHKQMTMDPKYKIKKRGKLTEHVMVGADRLTLDMTNNDIFIETIVKIPAGSSGGLVSKAATKGYELNIDATGKPVMSIHAGNTATGTAAKGIADGKWHHLVFEVDRNAKTMHCYVDGKPVKVSMSGTLPATSVSLSNPADFVVGRNKNGKHLAMTMDFLKVAHHTLQSSHTTIEELYAWQFKGPHTRRWWEK